jgi:hypothetical protein
MQKLLVFALASAAATLALGGSFASGATSSDDDHTQRIVVVATLTSFHFIDLGPKGVSPGDETAFTKTFKDSSGAVVGFGRGNCVVITAKQGNPTSAECNGTTRFGRRGTIQSAGVDHITARETFAIVGGTGQFRRAQGQVIAGGGPGGADIYEIVS